LRAEARRREAVRGGGSSTRPSARQATDGVSSAANMVIVQGARVDYPTLERMPKDSFHWYREHIASSRRASLAA
jgi:hypothetical protein